MRKLLLFFAMLSASIGAWAGPHDVTQDPNDATKYWIGDDNQNYFTVADGVVTFHVAKTNPQGQPESLIDSPAWNNISNKFNGATRIKFANDCLITKKDLEKFLQGNTYYVDLFDITNGENAKMSTTDIDPIIEAAVNDMVDNSWQAKGIILPLNTSLGTSKVEKLMLQYGNKYATFSEYAVYYKQNIATIYAHDETIQYTYPSQNANVAQGHFNTAYTHLTEHSEVNPDIYMVSTNNDRRLDLSSIPSGKTKISIINDEMVYRETLANIYVETTGTGKFAEAVEYTNIEYTPCEQLVIEGPVSGADVTAVNAFNDNSVSGPKVFNFAATTGATKAMLKDITNSKLEYVVLPNDLATEQIVASDFSDALTASTNTNFKAAIAPSDDSKKLSAYVKEAGSLAMARYYATGGSYDQYNAPYYSPSVKSLTDVILSGNLNASDINSSGKVSSDGHWGDSNQAKTGLNGEAATLKKMDLENAVFADQYDMNLNKAGYESLTSVVLPTSQDMTIIPAHCLDNISTLKELCIPHNYKYIEDGAFWGTGIDHITATDAAGAVIDNGPLTYTLPASLLQLGITPEPVTNAITKPIFPQNMGVTDIYSLATKAPKCYKNVFPKNACNGWGGFYDNVPYCRDKYYNGGNPLQSFAVLRFPSEESFNASSVTDNTYQEMKQHYTDVNKVFTKFEQTGAVDANGDPITWPTLEEIYRVYNQASLGLTWNDWEVDYTDQGIPQVIGGQPEAALNNGVYTKTENVPATGTGEGDYDFDEYAGWHQLVLCQATYVEPDEYKKDERYYEEAGLYTFCIPFDMTIEQVCKMMGVPASNPAKNMKSMLKDKDTGEFSDVGESPLMPEIYQLHQVTRKKGTSASDNNVVHFILTSDLYNSGSPQYLDFEHGETDETITFASAIDTDHPNRCLVGGRPYIIKAYKRVNPGAMVDQYKISGQNLGKYIMTHYADEFGVEASCLNSGLYEQLGDGDLLTLRFAIPYEQHKVQAMKYGEESSPVTYEDGAKKYYYTMVGQYWQQDLPQYCIYMSKGTWYRYKTLKGYTWDPFKCIIMPTQEIDDGHPNGGKYRDNDRSNYPNVVSGTDDLLDGEFKLGFLDGRDDDDFKTNNGAKYIFTFDDGFEEYDAEGNLVTAIKKLDGEDLTISSGDGKVYNMSGQYVGKSVNGLPKGMYIVNGKKYVVK